eukprot:12379190-Alexandrium_andersonii.AAC.1
MLCQGPGGVLHGLAPGQGVFGVCLHPERFAGGSNNGAGAQGVGKRGGSAGPGFGHMVPEAISVAKSPPGVALIRGFKVPSRRTTRN